MNKTAPATLARITLSNGEKTVVFQSMMHIASPGFYDDIKKDMEQLVWQDYVFFYEWVKPGSEASLEKLSNLVGTDVSPEMYDTLADIAGLSFQGDEIFLNILPSVNVDLSTDEIVAIAEKNNIIAPAGEQAMIIDSVKKYYPTMSPFQKNIAQVLSRGMMNVLLRTYTSKNFISDIQSELPVFSILLDERNKNIVQSVIDSPSKKIYIHYGALHFSWVYAELKKLDPKWEEVARTYYTVIR